MQSDLFAFVNFKQKSRRFFYTLIQTFFRRQSSTKYSLTFQFHTFFDVLGHKLHLYTILLFFYIQLKSYCFLCPRRKNNKNTRAAFTPRGYSDIFTFNSTQKKQTDHLRNPLTISSSASFSVSPSVISLTSCSPAIFPIAASCISEASG